MPSSFTDQQPTRAVHQPEDLLGKARSAPAPAAARSSLFDEPTRLGDVDSHLLEQSRNTPAEEYPPKFLPATTEIAPMHFDEPLDEDATRMAHNPGAPRGKAKLPPPGTRPKGTDERTRAVDVRNDGSINDIDWDID